MLQAEKIIKGETKMKRKHIGLNILACSMSLSMFCGLATPALACERQARQIAWNEIQHSKVSDLKFTSQLDTGEQPTNSNTNSSNTEDGSTATSSEPSQPQTNLTEKEMVTLTTSTNYDSDKTHATLVVESSNEDSTLSLTEDCKDFYQDVFDSGMLEQIDSDKNKMEFKTNANGVYSFDVDIKDKNGTVLDTQTVRFKVLDIVDKQESNEVSTQQASQETNKVATQAVNSTVETSHDSKSLGVSYTSNGSYAWTIPSDIDLNSQDTLTVTATKINEEANAALKIKVTSQNDFKLKTSTGQAGQYTITKDGTTVTNNSTVLETTEKGTSTANLKFEANPGNFMVADTYNDTLTFTAQNGYATGTVLDIDGYQFIVMSQTDNDKYLVISGKSIGNIQYQPNQDENGNYYNIGIYDGNDLPNTRYDGQNSNTYEDSYIDKYLNTTYYDSLPDDIKNAIVPATIKQVAYQLSGNEKNWSYFSKDNENATSGEGWYYNQGTAENPDYIWYGKDFQIKDDGPGVYPLSKWTKKDVGYNNQKFNEIQRKVYLPSLEELSQLVDLENGNKTREFLKGTNNSLAHMWLRDSNASSPRYALSLDYSSRSLANHNVSFTWNGVRPAFELDLSSLSTVTVSGAVSYK